MSSYVSCEARVPPDHPLRLIRAVVDEALDVLSAEFDGLYARHGRPSIAPEKLLRASLLRAFSSIRSERRLTERLGHNPLFRWFVGLAMDAPIWERARSAKTVSGCWRATSRGSCWPPSWARPGSAR